ncbi:hypothetical protein, partial [Escherichia coli]|uniref:hypothetical protein n=1 Tax=Escherichia coli TaxID=562 RepID=UPI0019811CF8
LSAGIELIKPKFPISKAADLAGEAEDTAKNHEYQGQEKNAVCLFGIPVNWDAEFPQVVDWKNKLVSWMEAGYVTKGLLQQLFSYYDIHKQNV